jgi:HAD superfamily hydrolase (TIGR01509 family)
MPTTALIFDFDGLILDTESTELAGWQEIYRLHDRQLTITMWADAVGRPNSHFEPCEALEKMIGRTLDRPALWDKKRAICRELNLKIQARDGVQNYLRDARSLGLKIGLASSSDRAWVAGHLQRLGLLHYFHTLTTFEDTPTHKPEPGPYLAALKSLNVTASQAIALEDSAHGIAAAKAAGLFCVAVPNPVTQQMNLQHADLLLPSLLSLPLAKLLDRLRLI